MASAIFLRGGKLLLAMRAAHKTMYPRCWDILGGHVEAGETVEQALIRESEEEVGLTPTSYSFAADIADPYPELHGEGIHHIYIVRTWEGGEPRMLGDEHTQLRWFTPVEACGLPDLAIDAYRPIFMSLA